jgi:hypothetical protein
MPGAVLEAFREARRLYDADIANGNEDMHMGLSLRQLKEATGLSLPLYGFQENRQAVREIIGYCYEQGIIRRLVDPEDLFLLTDT